MVLLVSYDLNKHERPEAYASVKKMIEENAVSYKRPLYSQWLVETNENPKNWSEKMAQVADKDDCWLVVQVQNYSGWLSGSIWPWLKERI